MNLWEFANTEWENIDDFSFANPLEFDENETENNTQSIPISSGRKNGKSLQSGKEGNDVRFVDQEENPPFNNNINDTKSVLTLVPDHIDSLPRQSTRNCTKQVLYPGQIAYGFGPLPKVDTKAPEVGQLSSSANFVTSCTAKSHKYMI